MPIGGNSPCGEWWLLEGVDIKEKKTRMQRSVALSCGSGYPALSHLPNPSRLPPFPILNMPAWAWCKLIIAGTCEWIISSSYCAPALHACHQNLWVFITNDVVCCSPMFPLLPRFLAIIAKTRIFPPSFKMSAGYPITFEIINKRWQPSLPITLSGVACHFVLFSDCNNTIFLRELCNGKTTIACLETPYFIHKDRICCWYSFASWLSKTTNERCRLPQTWIQFGL